MINLKTYYSDHGQDMDTEEPLTRLVKQEKAYMTNSRVTKEMESAGEESEDGGQYRHSSISAVSISAIFDLTRFIILSYFPLL